MKTSVLALFMLLITASVAYSDDDPHLWLEQIEDEEALDWVRSQNERSLSILTDDPRFSTLQKEASKILNSKERIPAGTIRGDYLYNFWQDEDNVRGVWRRATLESYRTGKPDWQTLLDVDALAKSENENWVYDEAYCLPAEFELCLIGISRGGTDASLIREFDIKKRQFVEHGFVIPEAKTWVDWIDPDHLLVGTDWGPDSLTESGYPRFLKVWTRGTPIEQAKTVYSGTQTDVGMFPLVYHGDETTVSIVVRWLTFFEAEYHWLQEDGELVQLPIPLRATPVGVLDDRLLATLETSWDHNDEHYLQGTLVALNLVDLEAELVYAPEEGEAIDEGAVEHGKTAVFVELLDNVIGKIKRLQRTEDGWTATEIPLPENGAVSIVSASSNGDDLLVSFESLTVPDSLYYVSATDDVRKIMSLPAFYDASDVVVEQHFATSTDGTKIPYFVMARRDVLGRGNAPTIQYGYGGFQNAVLPWYYEDPARPQHGGLAGKMWVSRGGVLVLSNMRGGGEYGPAWHEAVLKHQRQLAYDDFFAIAEDLIERGITTPEKLGAIGRSNGGLLMGVALTQRPDLYAALDIGVPLADMMRYDKMLAGASWVGEYGDPDIPEDRKYLMTYSPYQNLEKNADYPEVFLYTSTKDDRVHPGHARKMAARLEEYGHPFLYYENIEGGHGGTANQDQLAYRTALEYMYFVRQLMDDDAEGATAKHGE